jgi:urea transport system permease protein
MANLKRQLWLCLFVFMSLFAAQTHAEATQSAHSKGLERLVTGSLKEVAAGVALLVDSENEQAEVLLGALLNGELYIHKKQKKLVFLLAKTDKGLEIKDIDEEGAVEIVSKRAAKRVPINNNLRREIKAYLAAKNLNHSRATTRAKAVQSLLPELDSDSLLLIKQRLNIETNQDVIFLLETAVAMSELESDNQYTILTSVRVLSESLEPSVRNALTSLEARSDGVVKLAASKA